MSFEKCPFCLSHNKILIEASEIWDKKDVDCDRLNALDKEYRRRFGTSITIGHIDFIKHVQKLP